MPTVVTPSHGWLREKRLVEGNPCDEAAVNKQGQHGQEPVKSVAQLCLFGMALDLGDHGVNHADVLLEK
ncbi:MAG: hypothetical protein ACOYB1_10955 [Limnohabitans sp.]